MDIFANKVVVQSNKEVLDRIQEIKELIQMVKTEFLAAVAEIDAETTRLADYIQTLVDRLASGGMSSEDEAAVFAALQSATTRLKGVAANPDAPVPPGDLPEVPV